MSSLTSGALTSVNELTRDGQAVDRWNLLHPESAPKPKRSYVSEQLDGCSRPSRYRD